MVTPVRDLRQQVAAAVTPLGAPVYDVLPEESYEPPYFAVGFVSIDNSQRASTGLLVFGVEVTLVGDRGDNASAQMHIDDLEWDAWTALRSIANGWALSAFPRSVSVGGLEYPAVVFSVEAAAPC